MKRLSLILFLLASPAPVAAEGSAPQPPAQQLDLSRLQRLPGVRRPQTSPQRRFVTGFVPGFLIGAAGGSLVCFEAETPCDALGPALIGGGLVGTALGILGVLQGHVDPGHLQPRRLSGQPRPRWTPAIAPVRRGVEAGLTVRF